MFDALRGDAELQTALAELRQIGRLAAGQRILVGPGRVRLRPPIPVPKLARGAIHHLGRHRAIGGELAADDRDHPA